MSRCPFAGARRMPEPPSGAGLCPRDRPPAVPDPSRRPARNARRSDRSKRRGSNPTALVDAGGANSNRNMSKRPATVRFGLANPGHCPAIRDRPPPWAGQLPPLASRAAWPLMPIWGSAVPPGLLTHQTTRWSVADQQAVRVRLEALWGSTLSKK